MSLHIGNLSSKISRDDLQRVFRRFGACTVRMKDKYGFVVYDYPASAEKALKTLRGMMICGQAITLSWSNKQPRILQRFTAGDKSYDPPHRRHYAVKEKAERRLGSYDQRVKETDSKKTDGEIRIGSSDLVDESISYDRDDLKCYMGESSHTSRTDHHGIGSAGKNRLEDDRWGEPVVNPSNENYLENGMEFDRYEPYHSDGQKELDEHQGISPLVSLPSIRKTQETTGNTYKGKSKRSCYLCGEMGHQMSKCPPELKMHAPRYQGGLRRSRDAVPFRYQESGREPSTSKSHRRLPGRGDSPTLQITRRGRRKGFGDKKRNRMDYEIQDTNHLDRARGPSSSIYSNYTSSRSNSPPRLLQSLSQLPSLSNSKSAPPKKSPLASSVGSSPSRHSGSKTFTSRSTSRSMSPTTSLLPTKVNKNVSSSPNRRQKDYKGSVGNAVGLAHKMYLFEEETQVTNGIGALKSEKITSAVENERETKPAKSEQEDLKEDLSEKDDEHCHSISRDFHELLETHVPQSDNDDHIIDNLSLQTVKGMRGSQNEEHVVESESDNSLRPSAFNSAKMSSEEVFMILEHYGLQHPEENERDLPVEIYFGSARLWPWEIIYYRRLKKGPISADNYSRRIAQNEEFGIVDKYIRGSSGWGELDKKNP